MSEVGVRPSRSAPAQMTTFRFSEPKEHAPIESPRLHAEQDQPSHLSDESLLRDSDQLGGPPDIAAHAPHGTSGQAQPLRASLVSRFFRVLMGSRLRICLVAAFIATHMLAPMLYRYTHSGPNAAILRLDPFTNITEKIGKLATLLELPEPLNASSTDLISWELPEQTSPSSIMHHLARGNVSVAVCDIVRREWRKEVVKKFADPRSECYRRNSSYVLID